jgi:hypothetical protein
MFKIFNPSKPNELEMGVVEKNGEHHQKKQFNRRY